MRRIIRRERKMAVHDGHVGARVVAPAMIRVCVSDLANTAAISTQISFQKKRNQNSGREKPEKILKKKIESKTEESIASVDN